MWKHRATNAKNVLKTTSESCCLRLVLSWIIHGGGSIGGGSVIHIRSQYVNMFRACRIGLRV